jgi:protein-S-isoprenylcysteine O-methyltransferase Ste14
MFARALLAFLALPGVVAFAVPVAWVRSSGHTTLAHPLGLVPLAVGVAALLFVYAAAVAIAFHVRVVIAEEPWLAQKHGAAWQEYSQRVPRWLWVMPLRND